MSEIAIFAFFSRRWSSFSLTVSLSKGPVDLDRNKQDGSGEGTAYDCAIMLQHGDWTKAFRERVEADLRDDFVRFS